MPLEPEALLRTLRCETVSLSRAEGEVAFQEKYHTVPVAEVGHVVHHCRYARDPTNSVEPPYLGALGG
jgi:hypothetical protein